jgi:hypothetical protein
MYIDKSDLILPAVLAVVIGGLGFMTYAIIKNESEMNTRCKPQYEAGKLDYECAKWFASKGARTTVIPIVMPAR